MPPGEVGCAYEIAEHVVAARELGGVVDEHAIADETAAWWAGASRHELCDELPCLSGEGLDTGWGGP
jgi:hypothetical protein